MGVKKCFGIWVPPQVKTSKLTKTNSHSIYFILEGSIPSKKNQKKAVADRKEAFKYIGERLRNKASVGALEARKIAQDSALKVYPKLIGSDKYVAWMKVQRPKIIEQMAFWTSRLQQKGLTFPIEEASMNLYLFFSGRYITDTANKQQTIQDLLVECGVLADDNYRVLNPIYTESSCYAGEIKEDIAKVTLTMNLK